MEPKDSAQKVSNNTRNASKRTVNAVSQNPPPSVRGRPKIVGEMNPYQRQTQFSEEFIQFGRMYLEWNLNQNYVWRVDFEKSPPAKMEKIELIENPIFQEFVSTLILNMRNMMEPQVGEQFKQICVLSYKYYTLGNGLDQAKNLITQRALIDKEFSYIGLTNSNIPMKNRKVKQETLIKFIGAIVDLIFRVAEREGEKRF